MGHFEVCHRFMLKFKPFKMGWLMPLFIFSYAIPALHVKCHSLQERNVLGNVLIVDHHIKKKKDHHIKKKSYVYIFTRTVSKALNAISDKMKLKFNLLC